MSTDCENLLKKFLILNPSKRGTLEVSGGAQLAEGPGVPMETFQLTFFPLPFSFSVLPSKS